MSAWAEQRSGSGAWAERRLAASPAADLLLAAALGALQTLAYVHTAAWALQLLCIACVLDGRVRQGERAVMTRAFRVCGRPPPRIQVLVLQRALLSGDALGPDMLAALTPDPA